MKSRGARLSAKEPHDAATGRKGTSAVRLYRINKVSAVGGAVIKKRDVLASSDREAVQTARQSPDCPICEVLRDGEPVGVVV